mmetsp:Transcript_5253/g.16207  ORF Transcript_5253/g.16207 Transcript_5253/m.16207 type:complete len:228 (+) Transcript_5253:96-779(+)
MGGATERGHRAGGGAGRPRRGAAHGVRAALRALGRSGHQAKAEDGSSQRVRVGPVGLRDVCSSRLALRRVPRPLHARLLPSVGTDASHDGHAFGVSQPGFAIPGLVAVPQASGNCCQGQRQACGHERQGQEPRGAPPGQEERQSPQRCGADALGRSRDSRSHGCQCWRGQPDVQRGTHPGAHTWCSVRAHLGTGGSGGAAVCTRQGRQPVPPGAPVKGILEGSIGRL